METKFQTSFIPRRPVPSTPGAAIPAPRRSSHGTGNLFMTLAMIIFVGSLLAIAGAFFWKQYLASAQIQYKKDLVLKEQQYDIDLIRQLKAQSTKITLAKNLLSNHLAGSKLFSLLSGLTAENIRFLNMDFTTPIAQANGGYQIMLSGYGRDLTTVAFQAKVLNKLEDFGVRNVVRNPIISDPSFNENGSISFKLTADVDPTALLYQTATAETQTAPAGQDQAQ